MTDISAITQVDFGLTLSHTFRGDLTATLTSPAGTVVTLMNKSGDSFENYDITFANGGGLLDDGDNDDVSSPYYERNVAPVDALSAFNGENGNGTWILRICDTALNDTGTYLRSQLILSGNPSGAAPTNDNLANAIDINTPFTDPDLSGATLETNELVCGNAQAPGEFTHSVWYKAFPTEVDQLLLLLEASDASGNDLSIGVYNDFGTGHPLTLVQCIDENTDSHEIASIPVDQGVTYYIRIASKTGSGQPSLFFDLYSHQVYLPIILNPGGTITGKVTDKTTGQPITTGFLFVFALNPADENAIPIEETSAEADGTYTLDVPPGTYKIQFGHNDYDTQYYNNKTTFATANTVTVALGQTVSNINAAMVPTP